MGLLGLYDLENGDLAEIVLMRSRLVVKKKEKVVWYPSSCASHNYI